MEAVGAAAALAQLAGLSLQAGKAARSLTKSLLDAPAEITSLVSKVERLRILVAELDSLRTQLPETDGRVLLPLEHRAFLSLGLQKTLDSLGCIKSICDDQGDRSHGVRNRLRWASLDKKKAQRLLQEARAAESELDFPLQILSL